MGNCSAGAAIRVPRNFEAFHLLRDYVGRTSARDSQARDALHYVPPEDAVRQAMKKHGKAHFPWGDLSMESGRLLGGLCLSKLPPQGREGEAGDFGDPQVLRRWALELRTPVEVCKDLSKALDAAAGEGDVLEALGDFDAQIEKHPVAVVEAGCSTALQAAFLSKESQEVRQMCLGTLKELIAGVQTTEKDNEGPLCTKLVCSFSAPFMAQLKSMLDGAAKGDQQHHVFTDTILNLLVGISICPAGCQPLLPLMPALASLSERDHDFCACITMCNAGLVESMRPHMQGASVVPQALEKKIAKAQDQEQPSLMEYTSLVTLILLSGQDSKLREFVSQPHYLQWMVDKLRKPTGGQQAFYVQVMAFPVLASFAEARPKLQELGSVEALCGFCEAVGLESANDEKAIDFAFRALAILMWDSSDKPWKDTVSDKFKELLRAALERAHLRPQAQKISFLILE